VFLQHLIPWIANNEATWRVLCRYWALAEFKAIVELSRITGMEVMITFVWQNEW
jgi:hypothetical protein